MVLPVLTMERVLEEARKPTYESILPWYYGPDSRVAMFRHPSGPMNAIVQDGKVYFQQGIKLVAEYPLKE